MWIESCSMFYGAFYSLSIFFLWQLYILILPSSLPLQSPQSSKKKEKNGIYRKVAKAVQKKSFSKPFLNCSLDASSPPHTLVIVSCKVILLQIYNTAFKNRELTLRHHYQLILRPCSCYSHNVLCSKSIHFGITFCIECHVSLRFF